jgi:hypothetical protein
MRRPSIRSLVGGAAGILAGVIAGVGLTSISAATPPSLEPRTTVDAAHLPAVLTLPGEPTRLRYAIVCTPREDGEPCRGAGEVYIRADRDGPFTQVSLRRGDDSRDGRYFVDLPSELASSSDGFSYYAVLRDESTGASITIPSGGAAAPQRSFPLRNAVEVDLGSHTFGRARARDERVLEARWGSAVGELGLSGSRELGFVGPSAFDAQADGSIVVLDQVNGRVQHWRRGRASATSLAGVTTGLADLVVEPAGTINVLEPPDHETPAPVLRSFRRDGAPAWTQRLSDRTWSKLALGPLGPIVHQQPSEQWLPAAHDGVPLTRADQARNATTGKPLARGRELVVQRVGDAELRIAEVAGSAVLRAWRITSATPLGEVQLADQLGPRIVLVVKAYTDDRDEFHVLVLDRSGVVQSFAVDASQWAESAPLARFRLAGSSLYRLGSTSTSAFVDRFDLEVTP